MLTVTWFGMYHRLSPEFIENWMLMCTPLESMWSIRVIRMWRPFEALYCAWVQAHSESWIVAGHSYMHTNVFGVYGPRNHKVIMLVLSTPVELFWGGDIHVIIKGMTRTQDVPDEGWNRVCKVWFLQVKTIPLLNAMEWVLNWTAQVDKIFKKAWRTLEPVHNCYKSVLQEVLPYRAQTEDISMWWPLLHEVLLWLHVYDIASRDETQPTSRLWYFLRSATRVSCSTFSWTTLWFHQSSWTWRRTLFLWVLNFFLHMDFPHNSVIHVWCSLPQTLLPWHWSDRQRKRLGLNKGGRQDVNG
jgi:hypothetical protein